LIELRRIGGVAGVLIEVNPRMLYHLLVSSDHDYPVPSHLSNNQLERLTEPSIIPLAWKCEIEVLEGLQEFFFGNSVRFEWVV
jgi:hypothetical protein